MALTQAEIDSLVAFRDALGAQFGQSPAGSFRLYDLRDVIEIRRHLADESCVPKQGQRQLRMQTLTPASTGADVYTRLS